MDQITESSRVNETLVEDRSKEPGRPAVDPRPVVPRPVGPAQPKKSLVGRLLRSLMLTAVLVAGVVFGMYKMRVNVPPLNTNKLYASLDSVGVQAEQIKARVVGKYEAYFHKQKGGEEEAHQEHHKIMVTSPLAKDVIITQDYVCQIRSRNHIDVCALENGYLKAISIKEGQTVKTGDVLFEIRPVLYKAKLDAEIAERDYTQMELNNTKRLAEKQAVSQNEVKLFEAKLGKAQANVDRAVAELDFTKIKAPFDGIVDRLKQQQGSLIKEGDILTTLSDNNVMWVYFNVTEKRYLEYMAETGQNKQSPDIELILANHTKFPQIGKIGAIEANFNPETGNIAFRADFPNPDGLLRHGQTGTVLINRQLKGAKVIPQRATFENLAKRYVYVLDKDDKIHQREIVIEHVLEDLFVVGGQLDVNDKIVLEGIREVREGQKVEYEFRPPAEVIANQKNKAE